MTSNNTLALISDSSRDFFLNGTFRDSFSTFNIPEKKNYNKMMNSHSVSQNLKTKFRNCYNGFFKNDFQILLIYLNMIFLALKMELKV